MTHRVISQRHPPDWPSLDQPCSLPAMASAILQVMEGYNAQKGAAPIPGRAYRSGLWLYGQTLVLEQLEDERSARTPFVISWTMRESNGETCVLPCRGPQQTKLGLTTEA